MPTEKHMKYFNNFNTLCFLNRYALRINYSNINYKSRNTKKRKKMKVIQQKHKIKE